jgi:hypothetical protein
MSVPRVRADGLIQPIKTGNSLSQDSLARPSQIGAEYANSTNVNSGTSLSYQVEVTSFREKPQRDSPKGTQGLVSCVDVYLT